MAPHKTLMSKPVCTSTRFCLIRHGETDWNLEKRLQGQIDIDLNAMGEAQVLALRSSLSGQHFDAVYSSDLQRAWRTAQMALGKENDSPTSPVVYPAASLRERHYGIYQGLTATECAARYPQAHHFHQARNIDYDYETGESLRVFSARVMTGLAELAAKHPAGCVLVFTHGGVLDIVYRAAMGRPLHTPRDFPVPNAALNWLICQGGGEGHSPIWSIESWADTHHLTRTLDEVAE